jgi:hypothetical protein
LWVKISVYGRLIYINYRQHITIYDAIIFLIKKIRSTICADLCHLWEKKKYRINHIKSHLRTQNLISHCGYYLKERLRSFQDDKESD